MYKRTPLSAAIGEEPNEHVVKCKSPRTHDAIPRAEMIEVLLYAPHGRFSKGVGYPKLGTTPSKTPGSLPAWIKICPPHHMICMVFFMFHLWFPSYVLGRTRYFIAFTAMESASTPHSLQG